jgi:hypothetical protein
MDTAKNNVFKELEAKIISEESDKLKLVNAKINSNKETFIHLSNVSEVYTSRMFSIIGGLLGKK